MSNASFASAQEPTLAQILAAIEALAARLKPDTIESLPPELGRNRILDTEQTLEFVGSSPANWRRLQRLGLAPAPVMIGVKKHGWQLGVLIDYLESRSQKAPADEPRRDPRMMLTRDAARA
jgi:predicted DNA-binding transcriptional regulator AlpA